MYALSKDAIFSKQLIVTKISSNLYR